MLLDLESLPPVPLNLELVLLLLCREGCWQGGAFLLDGFSTDREEEELSSGETRVEKGRLWAGTDVATRDERGRDEAAVSASRLLVLYLDRMNQPRTAR